MTASLYETTGLSISLYKPKINTATPLYTPVGTPIENRLAQWANSYTQTIKAIGGYWGASFTLLDDQVDIEDWIGYLGYHVETHDPALDKIWEGFVDKVTINIGPLALTIGPFSGIANYVWLVYSTVDVTGSDTAVGHRTSTAVYQDATSQNTYGIKYKVLSSGGVTPDKALDLVQTFLEENRNPKTSQAYGGGASGPTVTVDCLGYIHFLKYFIYNSTTTGTWTDVKDKIEDVLGDDVNGLFSTDYTNIDSNTVTGIKRYDNDDKTAWDVIKGAVAIGDGTDHKRWTFGVYADRLAYYSKVPSDIEYEQKLSDPSQQMYMYSNGLLVSPWNVLPARYLRYSDLFVGGALESDIDDDLRVEFIEEVTYTAPWQISHRGGNMETLSQKMAALGLAGIGV